MWVFLEPLGEGVVQRCVAVVGNWRFGVGALWEEEVHEWSVALPGGPAEGDDWALAWLEGQSVEVGG